MTVWTHTGRGREAVCNHPGCNQSTGIIKGGWKDFARQKAKLDWSYVKRRGFTFDFCPMHKPKEVQERDAKRKREWAEKMRAKHSTTGMNHSWNDDHSLDGFPALQRFNRNHGRNK